MEIVLIVLIVIVCPWLYGLISLFRLIFTSQKPNRDNVIKEIADAAKVNQNPEEREAFEFVLGYLKKTPTKIAANSIPAEMITDFSVGGPQTNSSLNQKAQPTISHRPFESLENINILLYIGAFLIVVAAGIFVGFNYQTLSGGAKTLFLAIFTLIFYFVGLYLYLKTDKIKPAGLTFNTVGIVLFPLLGLAVYKFILNSSSGNFVWFATSLLTLLFYTISLLLIKKVYLNYLISFTTLSLFESTVALFNVPLYYFFWGMTIFALLASIVLRLVKVKIEIEKPFNLTSNIFAALSLVLSLVLVFRFGWQSAGVNLILASVFCFLSSFRSQTLDESTIYFTSSLILLPAGICAVFHAHHLEFKYFSLLLVGFSILYSLAGQIFRSKLEGIKPLILLALSGLVSVFACTVVVWDSAFLFVALLAAVLVNFYAYFIGKHYLNLALSLLAFLIAPAIYCLQVLNSPLDLSQLSIIYLLLSFLLSGALLITYKKEILLHQGSAIASYVAGFVAILLAYSGANSSVILLVLYALALLYLSLSFYLNEIIYTAVTLFLIYLSTGPIFYLVHLTMISFSLLISSLGLLMYFFGLFSNSRAKIFRYFGLIGPFFGAFAVFADKGNSPCFFGLLFLAAVLSMAESIYQKVSLFQYLSAGLMVASFEFMLDYLGVTELHVFMLVWSIYFAVLAYLEHLKNKPYNKDFLTIISLAFLTIPLFGQASDPYNNGHVYGLILGFESIVVLLTGMALHYKILTRWGAICLIIIVADQTKDALFALPKWLIIGVVGLAFLIGATYLLSKRQEK